MEFVHLLSIREAAATLGKSEDWFRAQLRRGHGPPARKVSPRCIVIRSDDLRAWMEGLSHVDAAAEATPAGDGQ
jgi:predicted DNA-binding transcriptional regulator AlpA